MAQFASRAARHLPDFGRRRLASPYLGTGAAVAFGATGFLCNTQVVAEDHRSERQQRGKWGLHRPASLQQRSDEAVLLLSDLDGTLVGDDDALRRFNHAWISKQLPRGSVLVYNTARGLSLFSGLLHEDTWGRPELLRPDAFILAEGTEIWRFNVGDAEPRLDEIWRSKLLATWDTELVATECAKLNQPGLVKEHFQDTDLRVTIFLKGTAKESGAAAATLRQVLGPAYALVDAECWVEGVRMVSVLPAAAGKGGAAEYLRQSLGFAADRSVWAGDTRGDSSMLRTPMRGILVGNATPELRADAAIAILQGAMGRIWTATSKHAEGVLQGLQHYGLE